MNAKAQDIVEHEPQRGNVVPFDNTAITPMAMISQALANGAGVETLTKLLDLQERWEKGQARKAFDRALAAAKAGIPVVVKNSTGHNNKKYADFAALAKAVDPVISEHGLSYRFRTVQDDKIKVTCILSHEAGHYEENTLVGPADTTGSKNAIQAIGSTLTYLQRYSLVQALGLAASEDDDGRKGGTTDDTITPEQLDQLQALIVEVGADAARFRKFMRVETLAELPAGKFAEAVASLEAKRPKQ